MAETTVDFISPVQITVDDSQVSVGPAGETAIDMTAGADGALLAANNLSDLDDAATAQTNLGGTAVGTAVFTAVTASDARDAIGARPTGSALFTANTASAARGTLGVSNIVPVTMFLADTAGAQADVYYVTAPVSGTVVGIDFAGTLIDMGDLVLTCAIGGVAITNGVVTATNGTAAGTAVSANPTAANTVTARTSVLSAAVSGGNSGGYGSLTFLIQVPET